MRKSVPAILSAFAALTALSFSVTGCGTEPPAKTDKLEFTATPVPSPFIVGDTSDLWTASKTAIGPDGRARTISDYTTFSLVSSNPDVVGVANGRFLVALKPGTSEVTGEDDRSDLVSETKIQVTVVAAP